jgi:AraC-like DNA-binding protein
MIACELLPCPLLRAYVRNYALLHLGHVPDDYRIKPYPTQIQQALVFFARGHIKSHDPLTNKSTKIASNALFGQHVSRLNFHTFSEPDFLMLMVIFQPGAMYRFLRFPSNELTQTFCNAEDILNAELRSVNNQIANASSYTEMIERVEAYLIQKLRIIQIGAHPLDRIGALLLHNPTPFSLDWLADQSNLSPRQFERKFNERIGIGPKLFSRISRFYQAFDYREKHPTTDWLTVAVEFGYTDYNHLAKDFKQFTNVTPNIILREYAKRPEITLDL